MSKKNRGHGTTEPNSEALSGSVATEALPVEQLTREQMLEHMREADPGIEYGENTDEELRIFVTATLQDETPVPPLGYGHSAVFDEPAAGPVPMPVVEEPVTEEAPKPAEEPPAAQEAPGDVTGTAATEISLAAKTIIDNLQAEINTIKSRQPGRRVASGSKARPNVKYTLLARPPEWHSTPQVAQLEHILFAPEVAAEHADPKTGVVTLSEPELFALVEAGQVSGVLRTKQNPVRIFQYYRTELLNSNVLRWS